MDNKNNNKKSTKLLIVFLFGIFILITVIALFADHTYELKGLPKATSQINSNTSAKNNQQDINSSFAAYNDEMHKKIVSKWTPPSVNKNMRVVLDFTIQKNGRVTDAKIYKSSGDKKLDDSALKALKKASPLPPLPLNFNQDSINVKFDFVLTADNNN